MQAAAARALGLLAVSALAALAAPVAMPAQGVDSAPAAGVPATPTWPGKPLRLVIPQPQGGDADQLAGPLATALGRLLGQPVVLDHRPGLGGKLGAEIVAKSPADGYTFLLGSVDQVIAASLQPTPAYDLQRDLAPVTLLALAPAVLVIGAAQQAVDDVAGLIRAQRANPAALSYASTGYGTLSHLAAERYRQATAAGAGAVHRPYRESSAALADLQAGAVDFMVVPLAGPARDPRKQVARAGRHRRHARLCAAGRAYAGASGRARHPTAGLARAVVARRDARRDQPVHAAGRGRRAGPEGHGRYVERLGAERGGQRQHVLELLIRSES